MKKHMETQHLKIPTRKCNLCPDIFVTYKDLYQHIRDIHGCRGIFTCEYCGSSSMTNADLQKHIKAKHLNTRDHKCDFCNKGFNRLNVLKTHRMIHTGTILFILIYFNS